MQVDDPAATPQQRRRRQFAWVAVLVLGVYAFSSGPAYWIFSNAWREKDGVVSYYPIWWLVIKNDVCLTACERYLSVCQPFASRIDVLPPREGACRLSEGDD